MAYQFNPFTGRLDYYQTGGMNVETPPESANGSTVAFTFIHPPKVIVVDQQKVLKSGSGWTYSGTTATLDIAPNFEIYSQY